MSEFVRREPVCIQTEAGFGITLANLATSGANRLVLRLGDGEGWAAAAYPNRAEATRLRDELTAFLGEGGQDDARGAMVEAHQEIADELRQENAALRKAVAEAREDGEADGLRQAASLNWRAIYTVIRERQRESGESQEMAARRMSEAASGAILALLPSSGGPANV